MYARSGRDYEDDRYERAHGSHYMDSDPYADYEDDYAEPQLEAFVTGVLEIKPDNAGMLRGVTFKECNNNDIFVSSSLIKNAGLRMGDMVTGVLRVPKHDDNFFSLHKVLFVNGIDAAKAKRRPVFDQLVPIYPNERYVLEHDPNELTTRIIDLFAPLGRGQRCLIVAPPKAGKTIMLKNIAMGISANCPSAVLMALLVDERPEEVTDIVRSIDGTVVASTFDEEFGQHIRISNLVLERARRLVELGKDVVIIMDSLTRLGRACNNCAPNTGRTMSGGLDISALRVPKHLFGSARNIENGGSLTIIATALIETGSKMDEVIFEEFKGTGNMEVNLSRKLAERRIFPAIDLCRSGTRHDELLYDVKGDEMWFATTIRQQLNTSTTSENDYKQVEPVIKTMKPHPTNAEYVARMKSQRSE
ncbi:transcription termination factor Rho [bacterium]|nr:transcription termination factor Rho [bacterium]